MTNEEIAVILEGIGKVAETSAVPLAATGPVGPMIAGLMAIVFDSAAAFTRAGKDPVVEVQRMHDEDPMLKAVRGEWEKFITDNFHTKSDPPPKPADTLKNAGNDDDPYPE